MPRIRPRLAAGQRRKMILNRKARHGIVGLRIKLGSDEPAFRMHAKHGERASLLAPIAGPQPRQVMDKRRDENSLARPRQAGDANAKPRPRDVIGQTARREGAVLKDVGDVQAGWSVCGG